ncbi:hypothetical protein [Pustulibacterium marinum]|nr:hypothetical protein [Pustulibacterium marinum]
MQITSNEPYLALWLAIPVIVSLGFINASTLHAITIRGNGYRFREIDLAQAIAILFELIGIGYWLLQNNHFPLNATLNKWHINFSFISVCLMFLFALRIVESELLFKDATTGVDFGVKVFAYSQLFFFINAIMAVLKGVMGNKTLHSMSQILKNKMPKILK